MNKTHVLKVATTLMIACNFLFPSTAMNAAEWKTPLIPVTDDYTLPNGLRVVLSEDHSVPVASVVIIYDVGARDEVKGKSGFAHLFEHMMFQGSENIGKAEHMKYVQGAGGSVNASTHHDYTNYYDKLPSNQLELALWLESDRLRSLKVTEENFQNQLETVKEEKRSRIDNQPYAPASLRFNELMFDNWANSHSVIGSFEDLESSSIHDVRQFFKTYYAPNNAVLAIVGDFEASKVKPLISKYFASIPKQPEPPRPNVAEPPRTQPRYEKVEDQHAKIPGFWMGWKAPPDRDPDIYPLMVAEEILSGGTSSRLYQKLVKGDQVALQAQAGVSPRRGPSAFEAFVLYKPGNDPKKVQELVWSEIERMKKEPASDAEVEKAKNLILRALFSSSGHDSLQRTLGKANMLAEYALFHGDPKLIDQDLERILAVTPADVQRVMNKYLTRDSVLVMEVVPAQHKADATAAGAKRPTSAN